MPSNVIINTIKSGTFTDQKPGTSGLRKKVVVFQQPHYTEHFIQATLNTIPSSCEKTPKVLVVGGDGRYYNLNALQTIIKMAAAQTDRVNHLVIGQNGIFSTPAASNLIIKRKALGGILLTASHNPGGPTADFGIKFNTANGGPAPENVTEQIYKETLSLKEYRKAEVGEIDLSKIGVTTLGDLTVEVIDSVADYLSHMKSIFDFTSLKKFLSSRPTFSFLADSMCGVTGPYAKRIFVEELGMALRSIQNYEVKEDFGGHHPDPNLTYAKELVDRVRKEGIDFGAAFDGDGDRNMIISKDWFVTPSDSVAVIAARAESIPYFQKTGVKGVARSMPTSKALDMVAQKKGLQLFEVPTGWKFFGNLMDAGKLSICGEESFGTGSDHIREKDGIWAVLAWLSILAKASEQHPQVTIKDIMQEHFKSYGRNYYSRYDYEEVSSESANKMMEHLNHLIASKESIGKSYGKYRVSNMDNFTYEDPVDKSISRNQGIRIMFDNGSRIIFRLSGTGSSGATIRLYVDEYDAVDLNKDTAECVKPLIGVALELSKLESFTGRKTPTVIT